MNVQERAQQSHDWEVFLLSHQGAFDRQYAEELQRANVYEHMVKTEYLSKTDFYQHFRMVALYLAQSEEHMLQEIGHRRGITAAKHDLPIKYIGQLIPAFRRTYWTLRKAFSAGMPYSADDFFELESSTNHLVDVYSQSYYAGYLEHKETQLRLHRELVEELSVPVIPLSATKAILPLIGMIDTFRAQKIQDQVLEQVAEHGVTLIILDLSGVPMMDTAVAGTLFRMIDGIRLLGCEAMVTGIRPEIAMTMVELGLRMPEEVQTKGSLKQVLASFGL